MDSLVSLWSRVIRDRVLMIAIEYKWFRSYSTCIQNSFDLIFSHKCHSDQHLVQNECINNEIIKWIKKWYLFQTWLGFRPLFSSSIRFSIICISLSNLNITKLLPACASLRCFQCIQCTTSALFRRDGLRGTFTNHVNLYLNFNSTLIHLSFHAKHKTLFKYLINNLTKS